MASTSMTATPAPYDQLAALYNTHLGGFSERLLPVLHDLALNELAQGARIADVCCGTGQLAALLFKAGFDVTGIDESVDMLERARGNAPGVKFICADASVFNLDQKLDAVFSTFDSMNHIVDREKLVNVFSNIFRQLKEQGKFVFDMNMLEGFENRWFGNWEGDVEGVGYEIHAAYEPLTALGHNTITINLGDQHKRLDITERCYSESEIVSALNEAGFNRVQQYDGHRDLNLPGEIGRSFFVCWSEYSDKKSEISECPTLAQFSKDAGGESAIPFPPIIRERQECKNVLAYPPPEVIEEVGVKSSRLIAIQEVLCRLPEDIYGKFNQAGKEFSWFIPAPTVLGQVRGFLSTEKIENKPGESHNIKVIYLSPLLEEKSFALTCFCVAHEIAHVVLHHQVSGLDPLTYQQQENEVDETLGEWGYEPLKMYLADQLLGR